MGITIGIYEMESKNSRCTMSKSNYAKIKVSDLTGFENGAEFDELVTLEDAKTIFPDFADFLKRNRINEETDAIYISKVKKDEDLEKLRPKIQKRYTNWVFMDKLDDAQKKDAITKSNPDDRVNGWDLLSFDEMNEECAKCPLSWNKGKGCIGAFGPDNSLLPEIAKKRNCPIVASALESVSTKKRFTAEDAKKLIEEVKVLTAALPEEGKVYVRRYAGPLERLQAMAEVCVRENIGFFFF